MTRQIFFPVITRTEKALPYYVCTIGVNHSQEAVFRKDGLPEYQLLFCRSGAGEAVLGGRRIELREGDIFFLGKNTEHCYRRISENWITDWITFDGSGVSSVLRLKDGVYKFENFEGIDAEVHKIISLSESPDRAVDSSVRLYRILVMCACAAAGAPSDASVRRLSPVTDYIARRFGEDITLADLASAAGVSGEHLCALFRAAFNMRPVEYINKIRIQKSKELLAGGTDMSIDKIGSLCGFNSSSYFAAKFRALEGITPSRFRAMHLGIHPEDADFPPTRLTSY